MINSPYFDLFQSNSVDKQMLIVSDDNEVKITNTELHNQQFKLVESICSENELRFGGCEASSIEFKVSNINVPMKGKWLTASIVLDGHIENPFIIGRYKVYSDVPTADKRFRNVIAYDKTYDIVNMDLTEWYNGIIFPTTVKKLRDLLFEYLEIEQEEVELPNDNVLVSKSNYYSNVTGNDVLKDICEINGCFGRINSRGLFEYVFLPTESQEVNSYINLEYEDYETKVINQLIISQESSDADFYYGDGDNPYLLSTRILQFSNDSLTALAEKLFGIIGGISYVPSEIKLIGNCCRECGDKISIQTKRQTIDTYILQRTLTGIQALTDEYIASGSEYYSKTNASNKEVIRQFDNKIAKVYRDNFYSFTYTNAEQHTVSNNRKTIIQYNVASTIDTDVIIISTIPLLSDTDGYIEINYLQDGAPMEVGAATHYISAGYNLITLCNYFFMEKNKRLTIGLAINTRYAESDIKKQEARISAIEKYIETGTYESAAIDTEVPRITIEKQSIRSVLLAKGMVSGTGKWDGTINLTEEVAPVQLQPLRIRTHVDRLSVGTQVPTGGTFTQLMARWQLNPLVLHGFTEQIGSSAGAPIDFIVTQQTVLFAGTEFTETVDGVTKLKTEYVVESVAEEIDAGYMSAVEIITDVYQSVESVVVK